MKNKKRNKGVFDILTPQSSDEQITQFVGQKLTEAKAAVHLAVLLRPHLAPAFVHEVDRLDLLPSYTIWTAFTEVIRNETLDDETIIYFTKVVIAQVPDKMGAVQAMLLSFRPHLLKKFGWDENKKRIKGQKRKKP